MDWGSRVVDVFDVHAAALSVREGDDAQIGVHLRDLLQPFIARAAGLPAETTTTTTTTISTRRKIESISACE